MTVTEKYCPHCKLVLGADKFQRAHKKTGGLQCWCRACSNSRKRERYRYTPRACVACNAMYMPWSHKQKFCSPSCVQAGTRSNTTKTPDQLKARHARIKLNAQVKRGAVARADKCQHCGTPAGLNARGSFSLQGHHHRGYDYPLDVIWLCATCHTAAETWADQRHPSSKLTEDAVKEIRQLYAGGKFITDIAPQFGVGTSTVWEIVSYQTWKNVA